MGGVKGIRVAKISDPVYKDIQISLLLREKFEWSYESIFVVLDCA